MRTTFPTILLLLLLPLTACDDDDVTGPAVQTNSTLSFILNGAPYSNTPVELRDNARGIWLDVASNRVMGILDALATFGGTETRRVGATLTIPSPAPGTYDWIDAKGAVLSASGLFLEIHHASGITVYQAVQGQTVVTAVGLIGSQVEGRFTGTLRSTTDGSIITISGGAFSLTRLSDQN